MKEEKNRAKTAEEMQKPSQKGRFALRYLAALAACFLLGCGATLALRAYDGYMDAAVPLADGERFDLPAFGFALTLPHGCAPVPFEPVGDALLAAGAAIGDRTLYIACYENADRDDIGAYSDRTLVSAAVRAGMQKARVRTFGGRRFLCCSVQGEQGATDVYQTWDARARLVIRTNLPLREALSVLLTLDFYDD